MERFRPEFGQNWSQGFRHPLHTSFQKLRALRCRPSNFRTLVIGVGFESNQVMIFKTGEHVRHRSFRHLKRVRKLPWSFTLGTPYQMAQNSELSRRHSTRQERFQLGRDQLIDDPDLGEESVNFVGLIFRLHSEFVSPAASGVWQLVQVHTPNAATFAPCGPVTQEAHAPERIHRPSQDIPEGPG